jgi:hypothetical protein
MAPEALIAPEFRGRTVHDSVHAERVSSHLDEDLAWLGPGAAITQRNLEVFGFLCWSRMVPCLCQSARLGV